MIDIHLETNPIVLSHGIDLPAAMGTVAVQVLILITEAERHDIAAARVPT